MRIRGRVKAQIAIMTVLTLTSLGYLVTQTIEPDFEAEARRNFATFGGFHGESPVVDLEGFEYRAGYLIRLLGPHGLGWSRCFAFDAEYDGMSLEVDLRRHPVALRHPCTLKPEPIDPRARRGKMTIVSIPPGADVLVERRSCKPR